MLLSRFWYVLLGLLLGAGMFLLHVASSMYNRAGLRSRSQGLSADMQVVSWYLRDDARQRSAQLIQFAMDNDVAKYLQQSSVSDAKVPNEQGTMTAILTWPASDVWPADGEIDILETPGNDNMFSTHYEGPDGTHWYDSIRSATFDASEWNHYEMTWLPDRLTIEVNGEVVAEWTDAALIPDVAHGFGAMGFVGASFDEWMGGAPDGSTPDQVTVSLDNVRMYQLDGVL